MQAIPCKMPPSFKNRSLIISSPPYGPRAKNAGKLIVHSHDWMAGGIITAYAKIRGCPVLHTVHNIHTGLMPPEMFFGVNMDPLTSYLYFFDENGRRCIAWSSGGKIVYNRFSEPLSMLGFAAASDVFGASLYEPCGQIDQLGNLYGATATNRDTDGYHDKIQELTLIDDGALKDSGNGFLFRDYDAPAASGTDSTVASNFTAAPPRCGKGTCGALCAKPGRSTAWIGWWTSISPPTNVSMAACR